MEYFTQQLINGLTLGSIYGLIAIGYTMVYGIIGMVNFAHGDVYMIGAFQAMIMLLICGALGISWVPRAAGADADRGGDVHGGLRLDGRAHRLSAVARIDAPGAADLRHRHVDRAVELRAAGAGPAAEAAAAGHPRRVRDHGKR